MGTSREKAMQRGCVKSGGREYVTRNVCAARLGISPQRVGQLAKKGMFTKVELEGYEGGWYDWQMSRTAFNRMRAKQSHVQGGRRERRDARSIAAVSDVQMPAMPQAEASKVTEPAMPKAEDSVLSYFDPEDPNNADCWETDETGEFLMIPGTDPPRHYVDWKRAVDKSMANIRYQQYMKERGELIPRTEVVQLLSRVFPPLTARVMQIPDKFASRIGGRLEEMLGRPMTGEETTVMRSLLQDEAESICKGFQEAVEEVTPEDD